MISPFLSRAWLTVLEGVSQAEMADAIHPDAETLATADTEPAQPKKKHGKRILAFLKGTTKTGVEAMLGTDRLKAAVGAEHAKNRLGVLQTGPPPPAGPVHFPARYNGKKGHAYITTTATSPALSWTTEKEDVDPVWSIAIEDIQVSLLDPHFKPCLIDRRRLKRWAVWAGKPRWSWGGQQTER
jgi:hypothetical protein